MGGEVVTLLDDLQVGHSARDTHIGGADLHLLPDGHRRTDTHESHAVGNLLQVGQRGNDTHSSHADLHLLPDDHRPSGTHRSVAVGEPTSSQPPTTTPTTTTANASVGWLELRTWCELFEDAMSARIAGENRVRALGEDDMFAAYLGALERTEAECRRGLKKCYERVVPKPIVAWQKATPGLGEHTFARLLGHLGHPVIATPHHWEGTGSKRTLVADEPYARTVSQLWQYCGHGDPKRRAARGMTADELAGLGSPSLKMIVHLLAEACMKTVGSELRARSPYRDVYDARRLATADRVHAAPCVRCGPSGKPAAEGSPWSAAHQHADALRIVGKEILRDLWTVAQ